MSTISAGTTTPTALSLSGDTTGALTFQVSGTVTAATISSAGNVSLAIGNLSFAGTGQRITGDMSNATLASRLLFQNSVTNGNTNVAAIPNGTSTISAFRGYGASDPTNATAISIAQIGTTESRISSEIFGTASYVPMTFFTGGSERMRISGSGNVGIGASTPGATGFTSFLALGNNNAGIGNAGTNIIGIVTNNAERMRIDSSGNVGIGTASPNGKVEIADNTSQTNDTLRLYNLNGAYSQASINFHTTAQGGVGSVPTARIYATYTGSGYGNQVLRFQTGDSGGTYQDRMTIDSSGNVGIGTASPNYRLDVQTTTTTGISRFKNDYGSILIETPSGGPNRITSLNSASSASQAFAFNGAGGAEFMRITAGGEVYIAGTTDQGAYNLQCNGTGVWGAGAYVNGSDARLKDNIQSIDSGLDVVKAMRPVTFQYKPEYSKDQSVQPGFIAQELQTAMAGKPYLEGVVQEGPNHLNVAYQNIIPILVKAMQEQQDQIKALQDKIAALESK